MKVYEITGKQQDLFHLIDGLNAVCPILLKNGKWVIVESAVQYYEDFYLKDPNNSIYSENILTMIQMIVDEIRKFPQIDFEETELHPVQSIVKLEYILDEKKLIEDFLKETLTTEYKATDTITQALTKITLKAEPKQIEI